MFIPDVCSNTKLCNFPQRGVATYRTKKISINGFMCVKRTVLELINVTRFLFLPCTDVCIYVKRKPYIFHVSIFGKTRSYPWPT